MAHSIIRLNDSSRDYYLEYSSVVDAPVTFGVSLEEFTHGYRLKYGTESLKQEFPDRMKRVEEKGTSSYMYVSVEEELTCNRAGKGETRLTIPQIIDAYCVNGGWDGDCPIEGTRWQDEE